MAASSSMVNLALYVNDRVRVRNVLNSSQPGWKARDRFIAVYNYILQREVEAGTYFLVTRPDEDLYVVLGLTKATIRLPMHGRGALPFFAYLHARYGLSEREESTKFFYDTLCLHIWDHGDRVEMRRFAAYNLVTKSTYISAYNGDLWRFDGQEILKLGNGEDGVFFADDDGAVPCEPVIGPHGELFEALTTLSYSASSPGGMTPLHQQRALFVWLMTLAFPDLMPTKPLLIVEGGQGSGKSSAMQLAQLALFGVKRPIVLSKGKEDDFGIILLRNPLCVFDNLDSYIDWLPDAVCAYATSAEWTKRKLYSDNEQVTIRPHAFIAVASKNPASFRREDTADRCIVLRLERRKKFQKQRHREAQLLERRARLLGEYFWYVNAMVKAIRDGVFDESAEEENRMADFAGMARIVGHVMGWPAIEVQDMLDALQKERTAFINEADSLSDVLLKWLDYRDKNNMRNEGREISLSTLFSELESVAQASSIQFHKSQTVLAQKLRSPHLDGEFNIQSMTVNGHQAYRIRKRGTPDLKLIPGVTVE